jgi:phenylalanyl-tRNA synthetase beta chain
LTKIKFTDIPKYPEVRRDLALPIDQSVTYDAIYAVARQTEKSLLKEINLFDVYEGNLVMKKSYAKVLSFKTVQNIDRSN